MSDISTAPIESFYDDEGRLKLFRAPAPVDPELYAYVDRLRDLAFAQCGIPKALLFPVHPVQYERLCGKRPRNPKWNGRRWVKAKRNYISARRRSR